MIRRGRANKGWKIDNTVSQESFVQLLKIQYLVSHKVISYNIKTYSGTKKHSKYAFPRKAHTKTKQSNNNEHIYNPERNLLNIQIDVNM